MSSVEASHSIWGNGNLIPLYKASKRDINHIEHCVWNALPYLHNSICRSFVEKNDFWDPHNITVDYAFNSYLLVFF
jgi:hypothetical protein